MSLLKNNGTENVSMQNLGELQGIRYNLWGGVECVVRGGSWNNEGNRCRCANRNRNNPDNRNNNIGFRCASTQILRGHPRRKPESLSSRSKGVCVY
ncbi:MAG: hypothetical protein E3K36_00975 [Candidatus Brocadia sp.]|nr:hypothetical protein [Candidatus Brocadia sp.]